MGHSNSEDVLFPILISTQLQKCSFFFPLHSFSGFSKSSVTTGENLGRTCSFHPPPVKQSNTQSWSQPACISLSCERSAYPCRQGTHKAAFPTLLCSRRQGKPCPSELGTSQKAERQTTQKGKAPPGSLPVDILTMPNSWGINDRMPVSILLSAASGQRFSPMRMPGP